MGAGACQATSVNKPLRRDVGGASFFSERVLHSAYMKKFLQIIILVIVAGLIIFYLVKQPAPQQPPNEAPSAPVDTTGWDHGTSGGMTFSYPADLGTSYISPVDWPPTFTLHPESYACVDAGSEIETAGRSEEISVGGHVYCRTIETEGAAGSTYRQYAYVAARGSGTAIMTFTLRSVQCGNYDEPNKSACEAEQNSFSVDTLADTMFMTLSAPTAAAGELCFARSQAATPSAPYAVEESVKLRVNGMAVTGTKSGTQSGPDMTNGYSGTLTGTKDGDMMTLVYTYTIEGSANKEKELYKLSNTSLTKLRYPLKDESGMLVPDMTKPFSEIVYTTTTCA